MAKAYEKYKDKGQEVLGLFVWDQLKNLGKAVKDLKITWPQLIDSNGVACGLYGVSGIPHIILFGPDGTIIARSLRGERIEQEIAEHIR
ncbi:TlpA disulfide reductase family protein [uncultured Rikenella sp.]|uniref:peroxiredoxin family protein n=1 Tax=uncultured Rikenella sp. TaxID=368003 RepID=UPI0026162CF6|nr:TlpA disulfide reductase family protein [uncultured Rikenella sp.]